MPSRRVELDRHPFRYFKGMPTSDPDKPEDYIFSDIPKSRKESISKTAEARATEVTKSALQSYLQRYFDPNGVHRSQLNTTAGFMVNYESRISGPRNMEDPTVYQVQLSRYWSELRAKLPSILLVDTGFQREPSGLGGISNSNILNKTTSELKIPLLATIPMELQVAALDVTTCSDLRDALAYIFGVLTHANKGHLIKSPRSFDRWEVRLPLEESYSGIERQSVTEDPADTFWKATISLDVVFEGVSSVPFDRQIQEGTVDGRPLSVHVGGGDVRDYTTAQFQVTPWYHNRDPVGFAIDGTCVPLDTGPAIDSIAVPSRVKMGAKAPVLADWIPAWSYFVSDNPKVALFDVEKLQIVPRRPGCFNLLLFDSRDPKNPIKKWEITVSVT